LQTKTKQTWAEPQFTDRGAPNFVSVRKTGKSRLDYQSEHRGLFKYPFTIFNGRAEQQRLQFDFFDKNLMRIWNYYYVRVTQLDGEMAWSGPIWVEYKLSEIEN